MTVATASSVVEYDGNGSTVSFPIPFRFLSNSHIRVFSIIDDEETELEENVDYTVSGANNANGGTVTMDVAVSDGTTLRIRRVVPLVQSTAFRTQGSFSPAVHESAIDYLMMAAQQLNDGTLVANALFEFGDTDVNAALVTGAGTVTPRTLAARFGEMLNVKDFGAVGNGIANDTAAVAAALAAAARSALGTGVATAGYGGTLYFPRGVYKITSALTLPPGVSIYGEGADTTQLVFLVNGSTDGVVGSEVNFSFIRDISFAAASPTHIRDLMALSGGAGNVDMRNVQFLGAGRYGLHLTNLLAISLDTVWCFSNTAAGLFAENADGGLMTTVRARGCYFSGTYDGPGADVEGLGINLTDCVFESNGTTSGLAPFNHTDGVGLRVRSGTCCVIGGYWENNAGHDVEVGAEGDDVECFSMFGGFYASGGAKSAAANSDIAIGGIYLDRVLSGSIVGGMLRDMAKSVEMTANTAHVFIAGLYPGPNPPIRRAASVASAGITRTGGSTVTVTTGAAHGFETGQKVWIQANDGSPDSAFASGEKMVVSTPSSTTFTYTEAGSNTSTTKPYYAAALAWYDLPGLVQFADPTSGDVRVGGRISARLAATPTDAGFVRRHLSATALWDPGNIADGAKTSTTITVRGADFSNGIPFTTSVGFTTAVPAGAILSAAVTADNTVTVTLINHTGGDLDLSAGTLRVDVWG